MVDDPVPDEGDRWPWPPLEPRLPEIQSWDNSRIDTAVGGANRSVSDTAEFRQSAVPPLSQADLSGGGGDGPVGRQLLRCNRAIPRRCADRRQASRVLPCARAERWCPSDPG